LPGRRTDTFGHDNMRRTRAMSWQCGAFGPVRWGGTIVVAIGLTRHCRIDQLQIDGAALTAGSAFAAISSYARRAPRAIRTLSPFMASTNISEPLRRYRLRRTFRKLARPTAVCGDSRCRGFGFVSAGGYDEPPEAARDCSAGSGYPARTTGPHYSRHDRPDMALCDRRCADSIAWGRNA